MRTIVWGLCLLAATPLAAVAKDRVIIFDGAATKVDASSEASNDLWLSLADLTRATKYELKPEGVCRDTLCFPIPQGREKDFVSKRSGATWFNLSEFARLVNQAVAHDDKHDVWYFGPRLKEQNSYLETLAAPNFALPDVNGKMHSLSEFRGKKVMLVTWGSW